MRAHVVLAAYVTFVIGIGFNVRAAFKESAATVVAGVIVVRVGVGMSSHVVLAATVVANMVEVLVFMLKNSFATRATYGTDSGSAAGCLTEAVFAYIGSLAHVTVMVVILILVLKRRAVSEGFFAVSAYSTADTRFIIYGGARAGCGSL